MRLLCNECGLVPVALFDGYNFGDRLLEGVNFTAEVVGNKLLSKGGYSNNDKKYLAELNEKLWLERANEYLEDLVGDSEPLKCAKCFDYTVEVVGDEPEETTPRQPIKKIESVKPLKVKIFKGVSLAKDFDE